MDDLRYPIGAFAWEGEISADQRNKWIQDIEALPGLLRHAVSGLNAQQLNEPYRPGGWSSQQVVHHLADSHMNSLIRFKLALTEEQPTVKPYDEAAWAELADTRQAPIELSLALLDSLHERWALLLRSLDEKAWERTLFHPASGIIRLDVNLGTYAWHGKHHTAHITRLRERMGW
ncbi:bacillithiol transferase BstA [Paenibacillus doosanensis]|uniref:Putative metal-dependent hydrolase SK3146_04456 n=1 Tax=Paenibacillus konkukensis TaxID=2020716 RepID=A0ABY4RSU0_9BACL|nr:MULTISPECIES: bacillithiol transferase BstA [Paenibacillus]MCS7463290.1 bacillithiol transferase BstA [Paenibacillus doosanensis]UQZ85173.1 Putative metal-dependent hydrolase YfiT [Paenibacillus konkukensis]